MTVTPEKPWTQMEEDASAPSVSGTPGEPTCAAPKSSQITSWLGDLFPRGSRALAAVSQRCAVPMLSIAGVWTLWGGSGLGRSDAGLARTEALLISLLIAVAVGSIEAVRFIRRGAMDRVRHRARQEATRAMRADDSLDPADKPEEFWLQAEAHARDAGAKLAELDSALQALTLQKNVAESQRRQLESVADSLVDAIIVTDPFEQVTFTNGAARTLFHFDNENFRRPLISEVVSDSALLRCIAQVGESGARLAMRRTELSIDGRVYQATLSAVQTPGAEPAGPVGRRGVVAVVRDVTLEYEASKKKSEFVAQAAHELRTPLSTIRAYTEMLADGELQDAKAREEGHQIIRMSVDRLSRLIDNVLNISRLEAGTVRVHREPLALVMTVKEALDALRPQAEEKGVIVTEELMPVAYQVLADKDLMLQAVLNVISNAIKYTPKDGSVRVRMVPHEEDHTLLVEVTDTGVGIPEEAMPRVFEKFYRVEANEKVAKGTGLGLHLVKQIVEVVHGGKVTLSSEPGQGTTVGLILPLAR